MEQKNPLTLFKNLRFKWTKQEEKTSKALLFSKPVWFKWISLSLVMIGLVKGALANKQPVGFLWQSTSQHLDKNDISILFSCDQQNHLRITLRDPGQPNHIKGLYGIIRLITNNFPPSGKGYKKFIYVSRFSKENKSISIHKRDVPFFLADLNTLYKQVFANQEQGIKEYDEKIKHCESLPKKSQQRCFQSSSGYQPHPPAIAIWIEADEAKRPPGRFNSLFNPKELDSLKKLPCYPK